jgi:succinate dehydrogenase/fumarate reductase iron-sulfur protein
MAVVEHPITPKPAGATCRVRIARSEQGDDGRHFDEFDVPVEEHTTLFDALRWIQLNADPTLSLRHSCLHASCGTCGMRVNGLDVLACVCMLADYGEEVTVEPLANLPVRTDLVVDMEPLYERFPDPRPIIRDSEMPAEAEAPADLKSYVRLEDCIECGICLSACPVVSTDGRFLGPAALAAVARLLDEPRGWDPDALRDVIAGPDGVWQCTTCLACAAACPAAIEHVPLVIGMRQELVERGDLDPLLQQTLEKLARQGNSYGKAGRMRARWSKALDFKIPDARAEAVEYLWYVGDFASFDERVQDASRRLATILHTAGVSFGLLYEGERTAGNDVHAIGEQGLFEMLVEQNLKVLGEATFDTIFTTDPHTLNVLRNDYPRYGLDKPVLHYSELLTRLVSDGVIDLQPVLRGARVTYHDPCYLARYNGIIEPPRRLIDLTGAELVEMPRHGASTFCCGAGGGRIWMSESEVEERPSEQRIREALALGGLDYFVVSCPKDLVMYAAAAETVGGVDFEVVELSALIERALAS